MKTRNIVFYIKSLNPSSGGVARVTNIISEGLSERGWKCYAIVFDEEKSNTINSLHYGRIIIEDGLSNKSISKITEFILANQIRILINTEAMMPHNVMMLSKVRSIVQIVSWYHTTPLIITKIRKFYKKLPIPSYINHMFYSFYKNIYYYNYYQKGMRLVYSLSDRYILLDHHYVSEFLRFNKISDSSKIRVISNPHSVDINKRKTNFTKEKLVLSVGRIASEKRIDRILRIWSVFYKNHTDWRLIIIGDGPMREQMERITTSNSENVIFAGQVEDIDHYYKKAKLILSASDYEGLPMSLIEAMGYGVVPIVLNSFSSVTSIISHGENGYIVNRRKNIENIFSEKMDKAIDNIDFMSSQASESVESFNKSKILTLWESLLTSLILQ